jgi:hypothetical protein
MERRIIMVDLLEVISKLNGKIVPAGDSNEDDERYENQEKLINLTNELIDSLKYNTFFNKDYRNSVYRIGSRASEFLKELRTKLEDIE